MRMTHTSFTMDVLKAMVAKTLGVEPASVRSEAKLLADLGLSSLDLVDLLAEIERDHQVQIVGLGLELDENGSVADLHAVLAAYLQRSTAAVDPLDALIGPSPLAGARTVVEGLQERAVLHPSKVAVVFDEQTCTYAELWLRIDAFACFLADHGVSHGDRVLLVCPNSIAFFFAYFGTQRLGAVAVPAYHRARPRDLVQLADAADASVVVFGTEAPWRERGVRAVETTDRTALHLEDGEAAAGSATDVAWPEPADLAMLQYTSGSTGRSKGVMLSHANIVANVRQMAFVADTDARDIFVSWLPVYHDMGLLTMTTMPLYFGARVVLLPITLRIDRWLEAITTHRGTASAAPDFAYRLAIALISDPDRYDLSSLRFTLNAAEPVRPATVHRFEELFRIAGIVRPAYGLAECTVGTAMWPLKAEAIQVDARSMPSVGPAMPGTEIRILADDGRPVGPGEEGAIVLRGPSCTAGYFRDPEATAALQAGDGFIHTGDLGYLDADGMLTITGRTKNLIIRGGRNLAPIEIETRLDVLSNVKLSAAVGIDRGDLDGEQIHVAIELVDDSLLADEEICAKLRRQATRTLRDQADIRVSQLHLVASGGIPRTHNGKVQHKALHDELRALTDSPR